MALNGILLTDGKMEMEELARLLETFGSLLGSRALSKLHRVEIKVNLLNLNSHYYQDTSFS